MTMRVESWPNSVGAGSITSGPPYLPADCPIQGIECWVAGIRGHSPRLRCAPTSCDRDLLRPRIGKCRDRLPGESGLSCKTCHETRDTLDASHRPSPMQGPVSGSGKLAAAILLPIRFTPCGYSSGQNTFRRSSTACETVHVYESDTVLSLSTGGATGTGAGGGRPPQAAAQWRRVPP
jgi:hypothetical protein